ncbi:MAG: aconitase/3-isopropylmalate dehydratase large subunit family protein [Candidatus Geothermarchaeales archaeon]
MTIVEKILARASGQERVSPDDRVWASIDLAAIRDFGGPNVVLEFKEFTGGGRVWDPGKIAITFDYQAPAKVEKVAENQKICRDFAREQGIESLFEVDSGIGQHVLYEQGLVRPGSVIVGTDSHMNLLGALGSFAEGMGTTDIVAAFASGELWFRVPETMRITLEGEVGEPVAPKDVILHVLGELGADGALDRCIEFEGGTIDAFGVSDRITVASMVTEMSGDVGFIRLNDAITQDLEARIGESVAPVNPDPDADYAEALEFDVGDLEPLVACPHSPDNVKPVGDVEGTPIDQAFLGSCTNGRVEDLEAAARVLEGKRVAEGVRMIVVPATREVAEQALERGLYRIFMRAGAIVCNPGCSLCTMGHHGVLGPGETCISTSNRNFPGKLGRGSKVYLASPSTVAYSAIRGEIADPRG